MNPPMQPQMPPQRPRKSHGCLYAVLGGVGVIVLLIVVVIAVAVGGSGDGGKRQAGAPGNGVDPSGKAKVAGVGDAVKDGKFTFIVLSTSARTHVGDPMLGKKAQGKYFVVKIKVKNHGAEPQGLTDTAQQLYGPGGKKYEADSEAAIYANEHNDVLYNDINPGNTVTRLLLFDVPKRFKPTRIVLHDSVFSYGATVNLRDA